MDKKIHVQITIPPGMSRKKFDDWLDNVQQRVSNMTDSQSFDTEELLENAELAKRFNGGSFNWNVKQQLIKSCLPDDSKNIILEFMKYGYLPLLHDVIQERKLKQVIYDDVIAADKVFKAKGFMDDDVFWRKKVWINSEVYKLILIGKGLEVKTMKYVKSIGFFGKNNQLIEEETHSYAANLLELI